MRARRARGRRAASRMAAASPGRRGIPGVARRASALAGASVRRRWSGRARRCRAAARSRANVALAHAGRGGQRHPRRSLAVADSQRSCRERTSSERSRSDAAARMSIRSGRCGPRRSAIVRATRMTRWTLRAVRSRSRGDLRQGRTGCAVQGTDTHAAGGLAAARCAPAVARARHQPGGADARRRPRRSTPRPASTSAPGSSRGMTTRRSRRSRSGPLTRRT